MQEPYSQINPPVQHPQPRVPPFPEQEHLKCPRCDSDNTKFCYYNNYNLSQPRHFCKSCRRYWTKGGTLRNIPVGGGSRKNAKRSSGSSPATSSAKRPAPPSDSNEGEVADKTPPKGDGFEGRVGDFKGAAGGLDFGSLLGPTEGEFSGFIDEPSEFQVGGEEHHFGDMGSGDSINIDSDGFLGGDNGGDWSGGSNGWPDLSMYTPGSSFL